MASQKIFSTALVNAIATAVYIAIVASFMNFASSAGFGGNNNIFSGIVILMLFVFSAALTGFLVFGRPAMWYVDGKKDEALRLLGWTLGIFFIIFVLVFIVFVLIY